jgi:site-specific DNA recombinase
MERVAIYCRVSSQAQEQEQTIQSQISELREIWKDHQIIGEYLDDGWSGEVLERPGLDRLRNDAKAGLFDILSVSSIDRLSRNLYHQGIIVEELKKNGVEVYIKDKPIADSPEGKFLFNVLGAVAEFEKEKILERTRRGRIYKVKTKKFLGYNPPYGYDYHKKTSGRDGFFIVNQREAEVVRLIFDLYLKYQSMTRVQKELVVRGIKPKKSEKWCRSVISAVLRNEAYTGIGYYNKRQSVAVENNKRYQRKAKSGIRIRPKTEWLEVTFPQIIPKEKFELAQKIRLRKFKPFGKSKYFYLLSGLIRCALCGSTFTGSYNGNPRKYTYYRCTDRRRKFPNPEHCRAKHIRADRIEPVIWDTVVRAITHQKILSAHILRLADEIDDSKISLEERKEELLRQKVEVNFKKKRLEELYFRGLKNIEEYEKQVSEFQAEENEIKKQLYEIESKEKQAITKSSILESLEDLCKLAKAKITSFSLEEKQRFLRYLVEEILLNSNTGDARIIGYIPIKREDFEVLFSQVNSKNSTQMRPLSTLWKDHGQCSNNYFKFELEVKV